MEILLVLLIRSSQEWNSLESGSIGAERTFLLDPMFGLGGGAQGVGSSPPAPGDFDRRWFCSRSKSNNIRSIFFLFYKYIVLPLPLFICTMPVELNLSPCKKADKFLKQNLSETGKWQISQFLHQNILNRMIRANHFL